MITALVSSLTKQGYITKVPSKEDKRSFMLKPTEKAMALVTHTYSEYYKTLELLQTKLGDGDFKSLTALLEKANNILLEVKLNG
jgi:DNA-binding MarR family transcriptional regulator